MSEAPASAFGPRKTKVREDNNATSRPVPELRVQVIPHTCASDCDTYKDARLSRELEISVKPGSLRSEAHCGGEHRRSDRHHLLARHFAGAGSPRVVQLAAEPAAERTLILVDHQLAWHSAVMAALRAGPRPRARGHSESLANRESRSAEHACAQAQHDQGPPVRLVAARVKVQQQGRRLSARVPLLPGGTHRQPKLTVAAARSALARHRPGVPRRDCLPSQPRLGEGFR